MVPGTGDLAGSLPTAYYSTTDPESFDEFLSKSDYLIGTLPSTPDTHYMLKKKHFGGSRFRSEEEEEEEEGGS